MGDDCEETEAGYLLVAYDGNNDPTSYDPVGWTIVEDQFDVLPCHWYWIVVVCIPEELGDEILIKVSNEDWDDEEVELRNPVTVLEYCPDDDDDDWGLGDLCGDDDYDCIRYSEPFPWHCPQVEYCNTYVVQYRRSCWLMDLIDFNCDNCIKCLPCVYVAQGTIKGRAHLHVIPEFALGTVAAMLSSLSGLGAFYRLRKK